MHGLSNAPRLSLRADSAVSASAARHASQALKTLALAAASDCGHEPWVFFPRGGRWRWWSFRRGWTEVRRWRAAFERGERSPVERVPAPQTSPQALCRHLAAAPPEPAAAVFDGLLAPRHPLRLEGEHPDPRRPPGHTEREIVVVSPPATSPPAAVRQQPTADRRRLHDDLRCLPGLDADRLAVPWLHWCCANLAVLVLEPSREALVGSVLWCRPTALLVGPEEERALAAAVREQSRGRDRRAAALLDRLRVLLVAAENRETAAEAREAAVCWRSWGVERRLVRQQDDVSSTCPPRSVR